DCGCSMVPPERGWSQRWRTPLRAALDVLSASAAAFFEEAGSELLVDPWATRDGYGAVIDAPGEIRDAFIATGGTPALAAGGAAARDRARLLLEMQRSALLMFASCGWYFDDIAGLETSLVLRLAAHTADLMNEAGGTPPLKQMLDLLATAKSNESHGDTGADVFRQVAADRVTPAHAVATFALGLAGSPDGRAVAAPPGYTVEVLGESTRRTSDGVEISGQARPRCTRTGATTTVAFSVRWSPRDGFRVLGGGVEITVEQLGRESRHRLLPLLLPRLMNEAAPLPAAQLALALGKDVVGSGAANEDVRTREAYAQLLIRLLAEEPGLSPPVLETALRLIDAAGLSLGAGAPARTVVEELVADMLEAPNPPPHLGQLAERLGFAPDTDPALAAPGA
ncbi:MAG: DUF3536 domain-containing protein, partial [Pseudomonadota bacterium]